MTFKEAYEALNPKQRAAVDAIDGPVMVVAGPGTGKTQLLATRAANILRQNSTLLPTNILCLTFTDSGQVAMQRRLIELMGEAGAHVAVHTFHSFGSEIINNYPDYFYRGDNYSPADELTMHEILVDVLNHLPYRNPLATKNQGDFVHISKIRSRIQDFKKASISPKELRLLAMDGLKFIDFIEPTLIEVFDIPSFSKPAHIEHSAILLDNAKSYIQPKLKVKGFKPLGTIFKETFLLAWQSASESNKTTAINNWKKEWFSKDKKKRAVCKQRYILDKLLALSDVYEAYQQQLDKRRLYDFDDMIMQVVQAIEAQGNLAYELQEQYQYFLVDEFQDTNAGQLRLLNALADHPVNEGSPNILVVGDDDQAIYAFQGAELNNILGFKAAYKAVKLITLTDNYRSSQEILDVARGVITQGVDRLESHYPSEINKTLTAAQPPHNHCQIERNLFATQVHEFEWTAQQIKNLLSSGQAANEIAVICREHKYLEALLPYLYEYNINVDYERRQNALDNPRVEELIVLAKTVDCLSRQDHSGADGLMPQLLSADYWQIPATDIWNLSLAARRAYETNHQSMYWLELMLSGQYGQQLQAVGKWLIEIAKISLTHSLEAVLDNLIGNQEATIASDTNEETAEKEIGKYQLASPFKNYYFKDELLQQRPEEYIALMASLSAVRNQLRLYKPDIKLTLSDFIYFTELCRQAKVIVKVTGLHVSTENSIKLLSAHGSKGLEFETVFILSAVNKIWDSRRRAVGFSLPPNLYQVAHPDNPDDNLRLFYVTMSRAKRQLFINSFLVDADGKEVISFGALEQDSLQRLLPTPAATITMPDSTASRLSRVEKIWQDKHWQLPSSTMKDLLASRLANYQLNVTHLQNFLNVSRGGPQTFLLDNLLQFPSAMSPSAAYGSAMHTTLQYLHNYCRTKNRLPTQKIACAFLSRELKYKRLNSYDEAKFLQRGYDSLQAFLAQRRTFINANQLPEQSFYSQGVLVGNARLTGRLDVLEVVRRQAKVIDYKTGKAMHSWDPRGKTAYEKINLYHYRQQLLFYKLLVEHSRTWGDRGVKLEHGELVFVEPDYDGEIISLMLELSDDLEIKRLVALIQAVWARIINLDFPDITAYEPTEKGIRQFEDWLIGL